MCCYTSPVFTHVHLLPPPSSPPLLSPLSPRCLFLFTPPPLPSSASLPSLPPLPPFLFLSSHFLSLPLPLCPCLPRLSTCPPPSTTPPPPSSFPPPSPSLSPPPLSLPLSLPTPLFPLSFPYPSPLPLHLFSPSPCLPPASPPSLPLQRLLFEAAEGGVPADRLRRLVFRCQQVGVSLSERLSLVAGGDQTEDQ